MEDAGAIADVIGLCFDAALRRIGSGKAANDFLAWQQQYAEVDPRVQVGTPWSSIHKSMRATAVFDA
jgi:hypothetical protein